MHEFRELCREQRVIPVLSLNDDENSLQICRALVRGGLRLLEITLRTPTAWSVAERVKNEVPDSLVGIGTVLSTADMEKAVKLGFRFTVSPGMTPSLLACRKETGIDYLPGVATASEIMTARENGLNFLKFFPAEQNGGTARLKAYASPFSDVTFCPTGGINAENVRSYLSLPNVCCTGGTWVISREDVAAGRWNAITARAERCHTL